MKKQEIIKQTMNTAHYTLGQTLLKADRLIGFPGIHNWLHCSEQITAPKRDMCTHKLSLCFQPQTCRNCYYSWMLDIDFVSNFTNACMRNCSNIHIDKTCCGKFYQTLSLIIADNMEVCTENVAWLLVNSEPWSICISNIMFSPPKHHFNSSKI